MARIGARGEQFDVGHVEYVKIGEPRPLRGWIRVTFTSTVSPYPHYPRIKFLVTNQMLAGRSPRRRMK